MTKPIQIRNEEVVRNVRELAELKGRSMTDTIAEAVRGELDRARRRATPNARDAEIDAAIAGFREAVRQHGGRMLTDDDLYDEDGFPH